ncbi:vitamin K-dependent gamma-carboxylase-like protein [Maribacter vaceletii]|uniref:Vitamin K-dependent gamma-carboxylase-like protein n=1 Tax=Maribacter vaceletii TaxID=1206816 RepID=A0A495EC61_9FLAO|nr:HTTM domain-containing protein [Maribacter vaceletii]RKR14462.1 vitamin K-dependent gamma-carboxylase-like protein [Maribacter vaceletii]
MLHRFLFQRIDNSSLLLFRIFFGILVSLECYGAMVTGWIKRTLIEPSFTFSFIGFEWLQPLPGNGMYFYFFIMGTLGVCIALGYKYRVSIIAFFILWSGVYLMQKTSYNNHYYLLALISFLMCFLPANKGSSLDAKKNVSLQSKTMCAYVKWIIVLQLVIVYTYASIAKLYGDWLDFGMVELLMKGKADYYVIGVFLQQHWVHVIMGTFGILFDLLVIPALLYKPTRKLAFILSIFFHLFNAVVFQIGIFPFLSLAFTVFFFEPKTIRNIFFKTKEVSKPTVVNIPKNKNILLAFFTTYFIIQLFLPIRHHFITDNVLWTEEGHRLSWRMMLRSRRGSVLFKVKNKDTGKEIYVKQNKYLTQKQRARVASYPDFMWQFAQRLKMEYKEKGEDIAVYAINSKISINGRYMQPFVDPKIDLANETWSHFSHHHWILSSKLKEE